MLTLLSLLSVFTAISGFVRFLKTTTVITSTSYTKCDLHQSKSSDYQILEDKLFHLDEFQKVTTIPEDIQYKKSLLMKTPVEFSCQAYKGMNWIRYLRIIKFVGSNYNVLNILAIPFANNSLPILGIDTVTLPGKTIIAVDLQPAQPSHFRGDFIYPTRIESIFNKLEPYFPSMAAEFPSEAKPYFSPFAILSKLDKSTTSKSSSATVASTTSKSTDSPSSSSSNTINDTTTVIIPPTSSYESLIHGAILDYITAYQDLIHEATKSVLDTPYLPTTSTLITSSTVALSSSPQQQQQILPLSQYQHVSQSHINVRKNAIYNYLDYRTRKDPAKNLLTGAFGANWTEAALSVFFPQDDVNTYDDQITVQDPSKLKVTLVTGSTKKRDEILAIIGENNPFYFETVDVPGLVELQGTAIQIGMDKCKRAAIACGGPVVTDDTGLSLLSMPNDLPGPYIKWFLQSLGVEKLAQLLLSYNTTDHRAMATCTVCYCAGPHDVNNIKCFVGKIQGEIVSPNESKMSPEKTFGWDGIFKPQGYDTTFADMNIEIKNRISHRAQAFQKLSEYLSSIYADYNDI